MQVASDTDGVLLGIFVLMLGSMHDRKAFAEFCWEDLLAGAAVIVEGGSTSKTTSPPER